jgi:hypothetical protein
MHAPAWKRSTLNQAVGLALVVGLIASVALNVVMLARSGDDTAPVAAAPAASVQNANALHRFADAKEHQIDTAQAAISPQATVDPRMRRFIAHKVLTLDRAETIQMRSNRSAALTLSQRHFVALKSDQLDGIQSPAEQRFAPAPKDPFHFDPAH